MRPDVNGNFSGSDIRDNLDIPGGARLEEQAFHVMGKPRSSIKYRSWSAELSKVEITRVEGQGYDRKAGRNITWDTTLSENAITDGNECRISDESR